MKQLSKFQTALFLLGGVLMVIGAASFAFGFVNKQIVLYTCWLFLAGNVLFSVVPAMQIYEGPSLVIHRLKRMQYIADIFFRTLGHLDGGYRVCFRPSLVCQLRNLYHLFL